MTVPRDVVFLLVPRFSMIALYGALEPLRVANRFAGDAFSWRFVSETGEAVAASNGIPVSVTGGLPVLGRPAMVVVMASYEHEAGLSRAMLSTMRRLAHQHVLLAGIDTGPFLLAEAGVLDQYRATCHWESLPGFRENYPHVVVRQSLFEFDRERLTCAGGAASIDMMLEWISRQAGQAIARQVADQLVHFRGTEPAGQGLSRLPARTRFGTDHAQVLAAIALMEDNLEEPLPAGRIAQGAGLGLRSLERVFLKEVGQRPMGFYREIRLERAAHLLAYSKLGIRDVAVATGFSSLPLFSRIFRTRYGLSPTRWRRQLSTGEMPRP